MVSVNGRPERIEYLTKLQAEANTILSKNKTDFTTVPPDEEAEEIDQ